MSRNPRSLQPELLDEQLLFTLREMCRICGVHAEFLLALVDEGVIAPRPTEPQRWQFDGVAVVRVQRAVRLQQDLGVNLPGIALALELLDELEALRRGG
jgi:chaperone modulatory protein CbpM